MKMMNKSKIKGNRFANECLFWFIKYNTTFACPAWKTSMQKNFF